jgi:hypothetical protein
MNSGGRTCVVPLHLVAVDALCKPQRESVRLDVRHAASGPRRCRETRAAGAYAESAPSTARLVGEQAYPATCLHVRATITKRLDKHGDVA